MTARFQQLLARGVGPRSSEGSMPLQAQPVEARTMLAAVLECPRSVDCDPLTITSIPIPRPGTGEALIRVHACGICRSDLHIVEGELSPRSDMMIPGHQAVGVIEALGPGATGFAIGDRVGVAWLGKTCGRCGYCNGGRENLCDHAEFTGWTRPGGFAQYLTAHCDWIYELPQQMEDSQIAPLLCAGIIGFRALRLTQLEPDESAWSGKRLGIYGFGAAGHIVIQLARSRGMDVYVCTRDRDRHQRLAAELGAAWVGGSDERPPDSLDASIIFAPAGELVPPALRALKKGGVLVLGGIHMSDIPSFTYSSIYGERVIRSVANNTRADAQEFLAEAARISIRTRVEEFPLERVNEALRKLKNDGIKGAGVLRIP